MPDRHERMLYDDPATMLGDGAAPQRVTADQLARGYLVRDAAGRIERRAFVVVCQYEDGSALVAAPKTER